MALHPDIWRYTSSPSRIGSALAMTVFQIGHWTLNGFDTRIARHRASGEFVGRSGLYE
ncbi:hypothetical protein [Pseudofrankia asymbiotica]|uniref:hypothetical protein n=1 Tax=Pseudofrankia asymbiotica TaxID=1834516 RepID=UPI001F51850A|nr:hypothetical protein [Pseudofrankia asymbiotica]